MELVENEISNIVEHIDFSFLEREPYTSLGLRTDSMRDDVIDFLYEELIPSRRDVLDFDAGRMQEMVESSYEAYLRERMHIITSLHRNPFDRYGYCRERWLSAFFALCDVLIPRGYELRTISIREKYFGKYNVILKKGNSTKKARLKAIEKFDRADDDIDDKWVWVEIQGVYGEKGWLYGGADYIIFETVNSFYIINRTTLIDVITPVLDLYLVLDKKVDVLRNYVANGKIAMFRRAGREDKTALVPTSLIQERATVIDRREPANLPRV